MKLSTAAQWGVEVYSNKFPVYSFSCFYHSHVQFFDLLLPATGFIHRKISPSPPHYFDLSTISAISPFFSEFHDIFRSFRTITS